MCLVIIPDERDDGFNTSGRRKGLDVQPHLSFGQIAIGPVQHSPEELVLA